MVAAKLRPDGRLWKRQRVIIFFSQRRPFQKEKITSSSFSKGTGEETFLATRCNRFGRPSTPPAGAREKEVHRRGVGGDAKRRKEPLDSTRPGIDGSSCGSDRSLAAWALLLEPSCLGSDGMGMLGKTSPVTSPLTAVCLCVCEPMLMSICPKRMGVCAAKHLFCEKV